MLVDDGSAGRVAGAAVHEAVARKASVRFLQIVPGHLDDDGASTAEETLFRAGLHALRGHPRTHSVFEVVRNDLSAVIRARSRHAALVVVGANLQPAARQSLTDQCLAASRCPVLSVAVPREGG